MLHLRLCHSRLSFELFDSEELLAAEPQLVVRETDRFPFWREDCEVLVIRISPRQWDSPLVHWPCGVIAHDPLLGFAQPQRFVSERYPLTKRTICFGAPRRRQTLSELVVLNGSYWRAHIESLVLAIYEDQLGEPSAASVDALSVDRRDVPKGEYLPPHLPSSLFSYASSTSICAIISSLFYNQCASISHIHMFNAYEYCIILY